MNKLVEKIREYSRTRDQYYKLSSEVEDLLDEYASGTAEYVVCYDEYYVQYGLVDCCTLKVCMNRF